MANFKLSKQSYWAPTPKKIRKIADSIVAATTFSGGVSTLNGHPIVGTIIFTIGFLAKIASNFFSEDQNVNSND